MRFLIVLPWLFAVLPDNVAGGEDESSVLAFDVTEAMASFPQEHFVQVVNEAAQDSNFRFWSILPQQIIAGVSGIHLPGTSFVISAIARTHLAQHTVTDLITEGELIMPKREFITSVIQLAWLYRDLPFDEDDFHHFISFTRFTKGVDKIWCDWCALVNGLFEMITRKLGDTTGPRPIPPLLRDRCNEVARLPRYAALNVTCDGLDEIRRLTAAVEQTWCPFKHLREIGYWRPYYIFDPSHTDDLHQARDLLRREGAVTCDQCNRVINEGTRPEQPSVFDDVLEQPSVFDDVLQSIRRTLL